MKMKDISSIFEVFQISYIAGKQMLYSTVKVAIIYFILKEKLCS